MIVGECGGRNFSKIKERAKKYLYATVLRAGPPKKIVSQRRLFEQMNMQEDIRK